MVDLGAAVKKKNGGTPALDVEQVKADLRSRFEGSIQETKQVAESLEVKDAVSAEYAVNLGSQIKKLIKELEEARKGWISEPDKYVRSVNEIARYWRRPLEDIEKSLKQKVNAFQKAEKERERAEAERKRKEMEAAQANQEAAQSQQDQSPDGGRGEEAEAPQQANMSHTEPPPQSGPIRSESGTATTRSVMTYRVTDKAAVPDDYKEISSKAVNKAIKDGIREIPGLEIYEETQTIFR